MSAEQNRCDIPKLNSFQYGPMLIHNPDNLDEERLESRDDKMKNKEVMA